MRWWEERKVAWGEAIVLTCVGSLATYLKPQFGVPILLALTGLGAWLIFGANTKTKTYKQTIGKTRHKVIGDIRKALIDLEDQINIIRQNVENIPLSHYEEVYLSKIEGYREFKRKYATEGEAQYVAMGIHYGLNRNPVFSDEFDKDKIIQSKLAELKDNLNKIPDAKLSKLIDTFINVEKTRAVNLISHRLSPARWKSDIADVAHRQDVEQRGDDTVELVKQSINKRLTELWNGAKYE
jgi:hypothetical protein